MNQHKESPSAAIAPLVPAHQSLPEITLRALILGTILTVILAAANAYLGLKVGQTISASIPAAIISMGILRFFRNSNVLENTMVQTMASVSEALIAGITFILPALIILHAWDSFHYWQTVIISLLGGILGVLFTIPLRRALLLDNTLRYPEGMAISNVFKASINKEKNDMKLLTLGGIVGAIISLCQSGFQIITDNVHYWVKTQSMVYGFGLGFSPALIAAGYIVGFNVAMSIFIGIVIGWIIGVPVLTLMTGVTSPDQASDIALTVWRLHIRYIGVGTMMVGSLWTLIKLIKPIVHSIAASLESIKTIRIPSYKGIPRTERDIPISYVFWGSLLLLIPIFLLISLVIIPENAAISSSFRHVLAGTSAIYILIGGFIFCSIAAYFAGLIGSTNTPVSGLVICALLILCMLFLGCFALNGASGLETMGVILGVGSTVIISVSIAIANDTMQDLKVGQVVGATPWKQQVMLILGVIVASFIVPPILDLLYNAYGIGGVFPRPNMDKTQMLAAPQAGLMAAVAQGIYAHNLEWAPIAIGAVIAIIGIMIDEMLKIRFPVLAIGFGIYLPLDASVPLVIGGILSYLVQRKINQRYPLNHVDTLPQATTLRHRGLLIACGIVAGASIMSVVLAVPFAFSQSTNALKIMPDQWQPAANVLGIIVMLCLCALMYFVVLNKKPPK